MATRLIRLTNKALCRFFGLIRTERVWCKPVYAIFEMSNYCNLKCPLCNTGGLNYLFKNIDKRCMTFETFKKGVDKLLPELDLILLYNWGEPFFNKELFRCVEYAEEKRIKTRISTNMMLYNEEAGRKLIDAGLSKLIVSCDGLTQESYERYRAGGELKKVVAGVENIIAMKKELKADKPFIEMQFIVFKHNEGEMEEFERFWRSRGVDSVKFIKMSYVSKAGEAEAKRLDMIPEHKDYQPHHPYGTLKKCSELYNHITIDWNGDWYTCCFPSGAREYKVGNIVTDDFWKIWNGDAYRYSRRLVKKQRSEGKYCETMCHDCTGIYPRPDTKRYW